MGANSAVARQQGAIEGVCVELATWTSGVCVCVCVCVCVREMLVSRRLCVFRVTH